MLWSPQTGPVVGTAGATGTGVGTFAPAILSVFGLTLTVAFCTDCGVHSRTFVCARQTPIPSTQTLFCTPSTSQDGSPSWQSRFFPLLGVTPDHST